MGKCSVNSKTINIPDGCSVSIINNDIFVNGSKIDIGEGVKGFTDVVFEGDVGSIESSTSVSVRGNVKGNIKCGGSVNCKNVEGDVTSGGSANCGNVGGNVTAGGSVNYKRSIF